MQENKEQKKNIRNSLEYFWMYYKLPFAAVLIVVIMVVYFMVTSMTAKESVLSVMLIDCHTEISGEDMAEEYMEAVGTDRKKYQVQIVNNLMFQGTDSGNYTMTSLSKFMADIGSEKLDVCGMLKDDFVKYDKSGTWMDLRECMTEEQLKELQGTLVTAEDGRVIGITADELSVLKQEDCYSNADNEAAVGIIYNTPHKEEAVKYLLYLAGVE